MPVAKNTVCFLEGSAWRKFGTDADRIEWNNSPRSRGLTCAGETQLSPWAVVVSGSSLGPVTVLRTRAKAIKKDWRGRTPTGCSLVVDANGVEWFCYKKSLRVSTITIDELNRAEDARIELDYPPKGLTAHTRDVVEEELREVVNRAVLQYDVPADAVVSILRQMASWGLQGILYGEGQQ